MNPTRTSPATPPRTAPHTGCWATVGAALQAGIAAYGLAMLGFLLARRVVGERWVWVSVCNNFVPWLVGLGVMLAVLGAWSRWRWLLVGLQVPGVIAFAVLYGDLVLPRDAPQHSGPTLHTATYNIYSMRTDPAPVTDVLRTLDADIVGLQEVGPQHAARFAEELAAVYPYQALYPEMPVQGVGLLSRYPIREHRLILPRTAMRYMRAVVDVDGVPVVVYVAHPPPPVYSNAPLDYDAAPRNDEITRLIDALDAEDNGPLLVLGDFNASDQSEPYRALDRALDDAFREAGQGLGFTFPDRDDARLWPLMTRIDYIWHNADFVALDAWVGADSGGSDHRPVLAVLGLQAADD